MKKKVVKKILIGLLVFCVVIVGVYLISPMSAMSFIVTGHYGLFDVEDVVLPEGAEWFDDYYAIEYIDDKTIAINEPRYWQNNYNYLIIGKKQALLFDSGPGNRDIMEVVKKLTDKPIIVMCSHYHYDHIGNFNKYDNIILAESQLDIVDLNDNEVRISNAEFAYGQLEGNKVPTIPFKDIVKNEDTIDLGERKVKVLYTPGHSDESISLFDEKSNQLFTGDFFYAGGLLVTSVSEYKATTEDLLQLIDDNTLILGSHAKDWKPSKLNKQDLMDLYHVISSIQTENVTDTMKVNDKMFIRSIPFQ